MKTTLVSKPHIVNRSVTFVSEAVGQTSSLGLKRIKLLGFLIALVVAGTQQLYASDPIGIFALIDKVVLEPNDSSPERIQIWGAFALAEKGGGDRYESPRKGYLYYKLPTDKPEVARKEWADLKAVAGKRDIIGFGTRFGEKGTVRKTNDKAANPDAYPVGWGLIRMNDRGTDYPPIRQLLAVAQEKAAKSKSDQ